MSDYQIDSLKYYLTNQAAIFLQEDIKKTWIKLWYNLRETYIGGLRLTDAGFDIFQKMDVEYWKIDTINPKFIHNKALLSMDRYFNAPWHTSGGSFEVFDQNMAVQLMLFGADPSKFAELHVKTRSLTIDNES